MTELQPATARTRIAAREYEGPESLNGALHDRQAMATAVEAAKRAKIEARDWLWNAREAERTLGRMILAAREAGDLTEHGGDRHSASSSDVPNLKAYGIDTDLAAHSVQLAKIPDDVWVSWHEDEADATQQAVAGTARRYLARVEDVKRRSDAAAARAEQAKREAAEARRRFKEAEAARPDVPPLTDDETSLAGADLALDLATPEDIQPQADKRPEVVIQERLVAAMSALAERMEKHDPVIRTDEWRDADVFAARDAARRVTNAVAVWLRTLNALNEKRTEDGQADDEI